MNNSERIVTLSGNRRSEYKQNIETVAVEKVLTILQEQSITMEDET